MDDSTVNVLGVEKKVYVVAVMDSAERVVETELGIGVSVLFFNEFLERLEYLEYLVPLGYLVYLLVLEVLLKL